MWQRKPPIIQARPLRHAKRPTWPKYRVQAAGVFFLVLAGLCSLVTGYLVVPQLFRAVNPTEEHASEVWMGAAFIFGVIGLLCVIVSANMPPHRSK
jgi:hypothetical protein